MSKETFSFFDKPRYSIDELSLAALDSSLEYSKLREELIKFLTKNHKHLTIPEMSQILGVSPKVILKLLPNSCLKDINKYKTQTIVIWKSPELAEEDSQRFKELTL